METEPGDRYETANELADDIENWLAGEPASCYQENRFERVDRWIRNHKSIAFSALAAFVLVSTIAIASAFLVMRFQEERRVARQQQSLIENVQRYSETIRQMELRLQQRSPGFAKANLNDLRVATGIDSVLRDESAMRTLAVNTMAAVDLESTWSVDMQITRPGKIAYSSDDWLPRSQFGTLLAHSSVPRKNTLKNTVFLKVF